MEPKISVIIPVYNVEPFLARCLDSVVGQTLRDIEIICVDDGSPDRSIDILNRYAAEDARIRVISQENRGLGGARNRGFDAAAGEKPGVPRKPAPDGVAAVLRALRADPARAVYIGDSEVDVATARNAGLPCISVSWGFRDRDVLVNAGAETICDSMDALYRALREG